MPLYEYKCSQCHFIFEILQRFSDKPPMKCPRCGGTVSKVLSPPALQFKGEGWYITDYAHKKSPDKEEKTKEKPAPEKTEPKAKVPDSTSSD